MATPSNLARLCLDTLAHDLPMLERIDQYLRGIQDDPYMPDSADAEYKLLAKRSITNVMGFIVGTPAQAMYADSFRRGHASRESTDKPTLVKTQAVQPEWDHWQQSRLDARQAAVYRGALAYGHSFVLTEKRKDGKVYSKGLSALRTAAVYDDPANDDTPVFAVTVTAWPKGNAPGTARGFDAKHEYAITFKNIDDTKNGVTVKRVKAHGATECPVTRFAAAVDLEGRTCGVVEPMIPLQNRINQTVFDLLIVQSFASFKVRTVTGMAPPMKMKPIYEDGEIIGMEPELDDNGRPVPENININAKRFFFAEDTEARFGTLDETPLDGFIKAIEMAFRHIAALSQTPPHHLLGQIANLSAEALTAAETALSRKVDEFKSSFGESWERVFRLAAEIGEFSGADDFHGEVIWRDMEQRSLAQAGDALGKLKEQLGIPARGLWPRVPNVTANELAHWEELAEEEEGERAVGAAARRAVASVSDPRPTFRQPVLDQSAADVV